MYKRLLAALLFTLYSSTLAATPIVIKDDPGGKVLQYNDRWYRYEASGADIIIDGACASACARFMTLPKACATPQANFYLHGITYGDGKVDRESGVADSRRWESPAAFALQEKYNAFAFGFEKHPRRLRFEVEPGVWIVHIRVPYMRRTYQKFLRVRATLLMPTCKVLPVEATTPITPKRS